MSRAEWRNRVVEMALEPELPIIDAHHHIYTVSPGPAIGSYGTEEVLADKCGSGHNVVATVYVDSHANYRIDGPERLRFVGETEFADQVAEDCNRRGGRAAGVCAAIVARADLLQGAAVGEVLDAHMAASTRFRGIRHITALDPDLPPNFGCTEAGVMMRPAFREGFAEVERRGLSFDACLFQSQLPEIIDLARAFPGSRIVLNHLAGPLAIGRYAGRRADAFAEWKRGMTELAKSQNVVVKVGGLNMAFTGMGSGIDADKPHGSEEMARLQRDHILSAIDLFGPDRCMFESDFPVDGILTSYPLVWNCFKRVTQGMNATERAELFAGTVRRAYRIQGF
jgi:predicted TIM-barrel fold metal-dependent hydrolase